MPPTLTLQEMSATEGAYAHVADGYRRALGVPGLPDAEVEGLRKCLRAALEISGQPLIKREED